MNIQTLTNRIEHWNLRKLTTYFVILGVAIGLVAGWFWFQGLYMTPERRFWSAINNSLSTKSVVRTLSDGASGNQVVQDYRFHFAPQRVVENRIAFTERSATASTEITTEGVIYPIDQFLRYSSFTNEVNGQDTTNIDGLLGQWAKQSGEADPTTAELNYLSEQVTLAIFGNYSADFRQDVLRQFQDRSVYGDILNDASEEVRDGEDVLVYPVTVKLRAYAELLNNAFVEAGYGEFPPLTPSNYEEGSTVNSTFVIRKRDNVIVGISFGGRDEVYSNYGVIKQVEAPEPTLSIEELQSQVQSLIQ